MPNLRDLTGQRYGSFTVLQRADNLILANGKPRTMWLCKCDCGTVKEVSGQSLVQGTTVSCGCVHKQTFRKPIADMTGERYGKLVVVQYDHTRTTSTNQHKIYWQCRCDCGNIAIVEGWQLRSGKTQSCGCTKSRGEEKIASVLRENGINFKQNKRLSDLQTEKGGYPLFDFQLFDGGKLVGFIEMQGIQHYDDENPEPDFGRYEREVTDILKKEYCDAHHLPLFEIKYTDNVAEKTQEIIDALYVNTVPRTE